MRLLHSQLRANPIRGSQWQFARIFSGLPTSTLAAALAAALATALASSLAALASSLAATRPVALAAPASRAPSFASALVGDRRQRRCFRRLSFGKADKRRRLHGWIRLSLRSALLWEQLPKPDARSMQFRKLVRDDVRIREVLESAAAASSRRRRVGRLGDCSDCVLCDHFWSRRPRHCHLLRLFWGVGRLLCWQGHDVRI